MTGQATLWAMVGFWLGAIPFSILLSRGMAGRDPRAVGEGNPGAFNAWRAAGWKAGLPALLLDYLKGAVPVALALYASDMRGLGLVPAGLAPIAGHAFSPFLRLRGGKALAVTFGAWTGLTLGEAPLLLGLFFGLFYFLLRTDAWAVMLGMLGLLLHLLLRGADSPLLLIWTGNAAILAWKHRSQLRAPPRLRSSLTHGVSRRLRR